MNLRRSVTPPAINVLREWFDQTQELGIVDATMLTDQMTYLPNDLLVKVDIASMANSLEARSPLLDHKIIEFAASLPQNIKVRSGNKIFTQKGGGATGSERGSLSPKNGVRSADRQLVSHQYERFRARDSFIRKIPKSGNYQAGNVAPKYVEEHIAGKRSYTSNLDAFNVGTLVSEIY